MIGQGTSAPDPTLGLSGNRYVISDNEDQNPPGGGELPSGPGGDEALPTDPQYGLRRPDMLGMGTSKTVNDPRPSNMYNYNPPVQTRPTPLVQPSLPTPKPTPTRPAPLDNSEPPAPTRPAPLDFIPADDPAPDPRPGNQYSFSPSPSTSSGRGSMMVMRKGGYAKKGKKKKRKGLASR